ncbi:hypothetical protein K456DRAFT_1759229 [Colletotrichum gloeosporioides 23]|nr:hypothetical protein K456DRAFT_1759229 [Colletotrichum gloeosporioides 23]
MIAAPVVEFQTGRTWNFWKRTWQAHKKNVGGRVPFAVRRLRVENPDRLKRAQAYAAAKGPSQDKLSSDGDQGQVPFWRSQAHGIDKRARPPLATYRALPSVPVHASATSAPPALCPRPARGASSTARAVVSARPEMRIDDDSGSSGAHGRVKARRLYLSEDGPSGRGAAGELGRETSNSKQAARRTQSN